MSKGSTTRPSSVSGDHYRSEHERIFGVEIRSTWDDLRDGKIDGATVEGHLKLYYAGCACGTCQHMRNAVD